MRLPWLFRSYVAAIVSRTVQPSRRSGALEQRLLEIGDLAVLENKFQVLIYVDHFGTLLQDLLGCSKGLVDLLDGLT
jgi:hypothetical protein